MGGGRLQLERNLRLATSAYAACGILLAAQQSLLARNWINALAYAYLVATAALRRQHGGRGIANASDKRSSGGASAGTLRLSGWVLEHLRAPDLYTLYKPVC